MLSRRARSLFGIRVRRVGVVYAVGENARVQRPSSTSTKEFSWHGLRA
jgi:hypothetical protein